MFIYVCVCGAQDLVKLHAWLNMLGSEAYWKVNERSDGLVNHLIITKIAGKSCSSVILKLNAVQNLIIMEFQGLMFSIANLLAEKMVKFYSSFHGAREK